MIIINNDNKHYYYYYDLMVVVLLRCTYVYNILCVSLSLSIYIYNIIYTVVVLLALLEPFISRPVALYISYIRPYIRPQPAALCIACMFVVYSAIYSATACSPLYRLHVRRIFGRIFGHSLQPFISRHGTNRCHYSTLYAQSPYKHCPQRPSPELGILYIS